MKNKYKLFLLLFIIITLVTKTNQVLGVGIMSHAWIEESEGERKLLFRQVTTPHYTSVDRYNSLIENNGEANFKVGEKLGEYDFTVTHTNQNKETWSGTSKWIYPISNYVRDPDYGSYKTIGFAFHTKPIGIYESGSGFGYAKLKSGAYIDQSVNSLNELMDKATRVLISRPTKLDLTLKGTYPYYSDLVTDEYSFYRTLTNIYTVTAGKTAPPKNYDKSDTTQYAKLPTIIVSNLKTTNSKDNEYRYAILDVGEDDHTIMITDWAIYEEKIMDLIDAANKNGVSSGEDVYISNITITKPEANSNEYELIKTGASLFNIFNTKAERRHWTSSSKGIASTDPKALGSALNLFDNIIKLPVMEYRKVLVRHINLDTKETISTDIIENSNRIINDNPIIRVDGEEKSGKNVVSENPYNTTSYDYYEEYEKVAEVDKNISVSPLTSTVERKLSDGGTLLANGYKVLGYNIGKNTTQQKALNTLEGKIKNKQFVKYTRKSTSHFN